jgi:hypothetical protein
MSLEFQATQLQLNNMYPTRYCLPRDIVASSSSPAQAGYLHHCANAAFTPSTIASWAGDAALLVPLDDA